MRNNQNIQGLFTIISCGLLAAACSGADGVDTTGGSDDSVDVGSGLDTAVAPGAEDPTATPVRGVVRDGIDGAAIEGAQVCESPMAGGCAVTDSGGHFSLEGVEPGAEQPLYVLADGYVPSRFDVRVGEGGAWREVLVVPTDAVDLGDGMGTSAAVLFRVLVPNYMQPTPVEGAVVSVGDLETRYMNDVERFDTTYGETGADGLALVTGVPLGELEVSASEVFGEGCQLAAEAGLVDDAVLSIAAGAIVTMDVFCR